MLLVGLCLSTVQAAEETGPDSDPSPQTYDLGPHFITPRTTRYEFWEHHATTMRLVGPHGEKETETTVMIEGHVIWRVEDVNADGGATCVLTMPWISATFQVADQRERKVDTRDDDGGEDPMMRWFRTLVETPRVYEMNPDGSVGRFNSLDAVHSAVGEGGELIDEEVFIEEGSSTATLPGASEQTVLNAEWERREVWSRNYGGIASKTNHTMQFRLGSVESVADIPVATVTGSGSIEVNLESDEIDLTSSHGEAESKIMFDMDRHEVVARNSVETVHLEVTMTFDQFTITQIVDERTHGQLLRIEEDQGGED